MDYTRREWISLGLAAAPTARPREVPWYRRACRRGQTNITEKDATRWDL